MAKISAKEREQKKQQLDEIVLNIFWQHGWHAISYASVAEAFGTSRGAIQRYYPSHNDFSNALKGKVLPLVLSQLDWQSKEAFYQSWVVALHSEDGKFRRVMEMLFSQVCSKGSSEQAAIGVHQFLSTINEKFEDESLGKELFGETFLALLNQSN